jgi:hypothetical protein
VCSLPSETGGLNVSPTERRAHSDEPVGTNDKSGRHNPRDPTPGTKSSLAFDYTRTPPETDSIEATALWALEASVWPVLISAIDEDVPSAGKAPVGKEWGKRRRPAASWKAELRKNPRRNVGLKLGAEGGVIDIDVDDLELAKPVLARLFPDGLPPTLGWYNAGGKFHLLFQYDPRLAAFGKTIIKGQRRPDGKIVGNPNYLGIEIRIGAAPGADKQIQSVIPPSLLADGSRRRWNGNRAILPLPESVFRDLDAHAHEEVKLEPPPTPKAARGRKGAPGDPISGYALAALERETAAVASSAKGGRNDQLNRSAYSLGQLVGAGALQRLDVEHALGAAARHAGLGEIEAGKTLASGIEAGMAAPRDISGVGRNGHGVNGRHAANGKAAVAPPGNGDGKAEGGSVSSVSESGEVSPKFEGPPRPIVTVLRPVPALDPVMLPMPLRAWVKDIADRGQCSLEFPAIGAIIVLASLIGRKLGIRPKRHDIWLAVANLWGMIVGRPGVLKSYGLEQPMAPVERLAAQARERYAAALLEHQRDLMVIEVKKEAAKGEMKKAAAKQGTPDVRLRQLAEKATATPDLVEPVERRYKTNDTTVPKLGELLRDNPWGLLLYRDELPGFFRTLDMQGHESDRSFYLEAWNGTGSFTYDRIGRGTVHIEAVCLSILGGIQPGPLAAYLRGMTNGAGDDGLISRFQLAVYPDQDRPFKIVDREPDTGAKNRAFDIFKAFDALNPADIGAEVDEQGGIPFLRFSPDAQEFFYQWWADLEAKLRADEPPTIESHLSKYRSLMPSLALLFHLVDLVDTDRDEPIRKGPVSLAAARMAAAWCDFLEEHARRIYQSGSDGDMGPARTLAERIAESLPNPFRARQVLRKCWTGLTTPDEVDRALGILEEHGWVCPVKVSSGEKGGAPTVEYHINPLRGEVEP